MKFNNFYLNLFKIKLGGCCLSVTRTKATLILFKLTEDSLELQSIHWFAYYLIVLSQLPSEYM
jgi:hypothetical protein